MNSLESLGRDPVHLRATPECRYGNEGLIPVSGWTCEKANQARPVFGVPARAQSSARQFVALAPPVVTIFSRRPVGPGCPYEN